MCEGWGGNDEVIGEDGEQEVSAAGTWEIIKTCAKMHMDGWRQKCILAH